jgi:hypothetical protein
MKKFFLAVLLCLGVCLPASAANINLEMPRPNAIAIVLPEEMAVPDPPQTTHKFCPLDLACTWTAVQTFAGGIATVTTSNINNIIYIDGTVYLCSDTGLTAAIAAAPSTGAMIWMTCGPSITFASTVVINKPIFLQLGAVTITGPASGYIFDVEANGVHIEGLSSSAGTGVGQSSVLTSADNNHAIYIGKGFNNWKVAHLRINDSFGGGRSAGAGIFADSAASPATNQLGFIDDVFVYQMYNGIYLLRAINSQISNSRVNSSKQDGIVLAGDGTTVDCINCYSAVNGGHGVHISNMAGVNLIGGQSTQNTGDGVLLDAISGNPTHDTTITMDVEANAIGIELVTATHTSILGAVVNSNTSDGVRTCGSNGLILNAFVRNNGGYGLNAGNALPCGSSSSGLFVPSTLSWTGNTSGNLNDPNFVVSTVDKVQTLSVVLRGATSGTITHAAPSTAGTNTITDPAATGTTSLTVIEYCGATSGATQACAKTVQTNPIEVWGDVLLNTATSQSITTLPFTDALYSCDGSDATTTTGIVSFNTYASASVTIVESGGVNTDHLRYHCVGH